MRRAMVLALAMVLLASTWTTARGDLFGTDLADRVYQAGWCMYLQARPYTARVPADVACEYEPRPMTLEEAGSFYVDIARRSNLLGAQWSCAARKAGGDWTWARDRRWARKSLSDDRRWQREMTSVLWPEDVAGRVRKLVDLNIDLGYRQRRAYNHRTFAAAVSSGDWADYRKASRKFSPLASQVRSRLGLPRVPAGGDQCKAAKRIQRQLDGA
jgi:hypothetical protein